MKENKENEQASAQTDACMAETEENLLHTYHRFPVVLERGEGAYLFDTDGKKYLDFAAGIAVCGLGYGNQELNEALKVQMDQLIHTSNLYYNTTCGAAAKALKCASGMDRVFFTNSGTEANEGALKAARKYACAKQSGRQDFIAMTHSFHGRTLGALSVTAGEAYREPYEPLIPGVQFAEFNDLDSVRSLVTDKTCAIILEPVQGEGGIHVADREFLQGVRKICDENDMLLIYDEIQCGMGRTGSMFAWQYFDVKPDILTVAKAVGSGFPVGAFLMTEKAAESSLGLGDHGTTFGGNPLACAAVAKTLEIFDREDIPGHVREVGAYLSGQLDQLVKTCDAFEERRGIGLIQGLTCTRPVGEIIDRAREEGLLLISAEGNVLRFVPPLIITNEQVDEAVEKLKKAVTD